MLIMQIKSWKVTRYEQGPFEDLFTIERSNSVRATYIYNSRSGILREVNSFNNLNYESIIPITVKRKIREALLTVNRGRTFGVELEILVPSRVNDLKVALSEEGVNCRVLSRGTKDFTDWKITTDGSIGATRGYYGLEVVSPILCGQEGFEDLEKVVSILNRLGCTINKSCGLHVHHGARDLTRKEKLDLFKTYRDNEHIIDSVLAPSRRGSNNRYCKSAVGLESHSRDDRYYKLNFLSYVKYGTVEFRQHQGTLNYGKIKNWIELGQAMISKVVETGTSMERCWG